MALRLSPLARLCVRQLSRLGAPLPHPLRQSRRDLLATPVRSVSSSNNNYNKYSKPDNDDVIEAEIVNDNTTSSGKDSMASPWSLKSMSTAVSQGFEKAKAMVGMDEKSIQRRRERKRIDAEIDNALRGTGLMGAVMGKFIKMGTHMISKSVQETSDDLAAIKECTEIVLLKDTRVRDLLSSTFASDDELQCVPFSTSLSSVQDNDGTIRKQCSTSMHVLVGGGSPVDRRQSQSLGTVSVEAILLPEKPSGTGKFDRVRFKSVLFQHTANGSTWKIDYNALKNTREIRL